MPPPRAGSDTAAYLTKTPGAVAQPGSAGSSRTVKDSGVNEVSSSLRACNRCLNSRLRNHDSTANAPNTNPSNNNPAAKPHEGHTTAPRQRIPTVLGETVKDAPRSVLFDRCPMNSQLGGNRPNVSGRPLPELGRLKSERARQQQELPRRIQPHQGSRVCGR